MTKAGKSYPERTHESVNGTGGAGIQQSKVEKQGGEGGGGKLLLRLLGFTLFFLIFQNLIKKFLSTVLFS